MVTYLDGFQRSSPDHRDPPTTSKHPRPPFRLVGSSIDYPLPSDLCYDYRAVRTRPACVSKVLVWG